MHKHVAQVSVLLTVQVAVIVVVDQPLREIEQGAQLAESAAVRLHLRGIVVRSEEGTVVVGENVAAFVNNVQ